MYLIKFINFNTYIWTNYKYLNCLGTHFSSAIAYIQNQVGTIKGEKELGSVLVNDFWTPPPPINIVHDQISIYLALFRGRLG